jgi:hypothetical protein
VCLATAAQQLLRGLHAAATGVAAAVNNVLCCYCRCVVGREREVMLLLLLHKCAELGGRC